jgi:hypothetical protein
MKLTINQLGFFLTVLVALSVFTQTNCKKEATCDTTDVSYKNDVKPLLQKNGCLTAACHGSTAAYPYETYAELKETVDNERLLGAIKQQVGFSKMPKTGAKLDDCSISIIEAWIKQGTKDN